jgi:ribose 5-phosphate isomerase A
MNEAKIAAGERAADLIENNMIVGLGSGSTAMSFINSLIERVRSGLRIKAVSSSRESAEKARKGGIEILDINAISHIDLTVDGADEIDPQKRMIKGGGGAHVREKILASSSSEVVIIADETKLVKKLGRNKLPIEVFFFGSPATKAKVEDLGFSTKWRLNEDETFFITENGNLLLDLYFSEPPSSPEELDAELRFIPGVIDTGFFFDLAERIIIGFSNGETKLF